MGFKDEDRIKALLWCDRHCCLCKKPCGVGVELHHIDPKGGDEIENAIPLCFDCHCKVGHYSTEHPRGSKHGPEELRARREQVYEEYTRHLVPRILYELTQLLPANQQRKLPDVGFNLRHLGDSLPVRVCIQLEIMLGGRKLKTPSGYYSGEKLWRLNPGISHRGHFSVPDEAVTSQDRLEVEVKATIIDMYGRPHNYLPVGYVYVRETNSWYFEP